MAQVFKGAGTKIAKLPGVQPVLDTAAAGVLARATANASAHVDTGEYLSKLHVQPVRGKKGVRDRLVVAGHPAAISIEYGHLSRNRSTFVPGQYILTRAIK